MSRLPLETQPRRARTAGFTLIELLVVISIIGLLSSVVLASLNAARVKARDAQRAQNMHSIVTALQLYYLTYNCLPITYGATTCGPAAGTYNEVDAGGWDYSSQGGFMSFLKTAGNISSVPLDTINNMTGDGAPAGTYAFRYYCYDSPIWGTFGPHLAYYKESTGEYVKVIPQGGAGWTDATFTCK